MEYPELQAECRGTDKEQEKHQETESPHTGEDSTDSGALTKPDARVLRNRKETKRKAEALRQTGNCQGLKSPKLTGDGDSENSIVCDEVKIQQVKFYVISRGTSKMSAKALVLKKQMKSTNRNESTSPESTVVIREEGEVTSQGKAIASEGEDVYFQPGYDSTSTEGVLKAVKNKGNHTLSLDGKNIICTDTRFTEYSYVLRYASGVPKHTIYFYECCKYPGYYMHWYCDQSAVNCEPYKSDKPHPFERQWKEFQWHREPAKDINSAQTLQYSRLVACMPNTPDILSPYYLTFKDAQPEIHQSIDNAMIFLITPADTSGPSSK